MSNGFNLSAGGVRIDGIDTVAEYLLGTLLLICVSIIMKTIEQYQHYQVNNSKREYGEKKLQSTERLACQLERVASMSSPANSSDKSGTH